MIGHRRTFSVFEFPPKAFIREWEANTPTMSKITSTIVSKIYTGKICVGVGLHISIKGFDSVQQTNLIETLR